MNIASLKTRLEIVESSFESVKDRINKSNKESDSLNIELFKLQGEYRLLQELINKSDEPNSAATVNVKALIEKDVENA